MRFMQTSKLFTLLPEELVCTPDGMAIDRDGNLILSCPNFADLSMPSCVLKIDKDRNIKKWFDVPRNEYTGEARAMGIEFGPDGDLYLVDNAGWTGEPHMVFTGRILRLRLNDAGVVKCTVVADNMEHPNGIRIWGDYMYVTQSCMTRQKTDSGKLMSCVYRFPLDAEGIHCTNTLADPHIFLTFITENPKCQYGVDGIVFDHDGNLYVGNFGDGMENLKQRGFDRAIPEFLARGGYFFGVCLGMQMLLESSEEAPGAAGLGIFPGAVVRFPAGREKVPHMGWNSVSFRPDSPLGAGMPEGSCFYFVHSYYVPVNAAFTAAASEYIVPFSACIGSGRCFAAQFHPEKSQRCGLRLLANFLRLAGEVK